MTEEEKDLIAPNEQQADIVPFREKASLFFNIAKFEHAQRVAQVFAKSTMVPEHFQGNVGNILIAMNYAERIGADVFMTMQTMYIIHGKPGIEGKLVIALLNNCGRFDPVEFEEIGNLRKPESEEDGCIAYTRDLKSGKILKGPMVDWTMVKAEGWHGKSGSKWKTMAPLMFRYRAATYFARTYCPEVLLGMQTREELQDVIDIEPVGQGAAEQVKKGDLKPNKELYQTEEPPASDQGTTPEKETEQEPPEKQAKIYVPCPKISGGNRGTAVCDKKCPGEKCKEYYEATGITRPSVDLDGPPNEEPEKEAGAGEKKKSPDFSF